MVASGYQVSQVYPIVADSIDRVICLATRMKKSESNIKGIVNAVGVGDGVDYFFCTRNI